ATGQMNGLDNFNSTTEAGEPVHAGNTVGASVWYTLTVSTSGSIDFFAPGFAVGIYSGSSYSNLTLLNDCDAGFASTTVQAGDVLQIAIDGLNGSMGSFDLSWRTRNAPANDNLANA